jgi:hypothetical protein
VPAPKSLGVRSRDLGAGTLDDMQGLSQALFFAGLLARFEHHLAEVERLASDFTELSRRQRFAFFLTGGEFLRGWPRSGLRPSFPKQILLIPSVTMQTECLAEKLMGNMVNLPND